MHQELHHEAMSQADISHTVTPWRRWDNLDMVYVRPCDTKSRSEVCLVDDLSGPWCRCDAYRSGDGVERAAAAFTLLPAEA
jgi:hypothetical protein